MSYVRCAECNKHIKHIEDIRIPTFLLAWKYLSIKPVFIHESCFKKQKRPYAVHIDTVRAGMLVNSLVSATLFLAFLFLYLEGERPDIYLFTLPLYAGASLMIYFYLVEVQEAYMQN